MVGAKQRIRVRKHNAYKVRASIENGIINIAVGLFFLYAAATATKGGGIPFLMGLAMFWCAECEFQDATMFNNRIGGYRKYKRKTKQIEKGE